MGHVCVQYFLECHMFFTPWLQFSFYRSPQDSASLCLLKFWFFGICEIMSHCGANEGKQILFIVSKCVQIHQALPRDITQQEDLAWAYLAWAGVTPFPHNIQSLPAFGFIILELQKMLRDLRLPPPKKSTVFSEDHAFPHSWRLLKRFLGIKYYESTVFLFHYMQ